MEENQDSFGDEKNETTKTISPNVSSLTSQLTYVNGGSGDDNDTHNPYLNVIPNAYAKLLDSINKSPSEDRIEIDIVTTNKGGNARSITTKRKKNDQTPIERYKTKTISFTTNDSTSDIKSITNDVKLRFNVLNHRQLPNEKIEGIVAPITQTIEDHFDSIVNFVGNGKKTPMSRSKPSFKTLLELTFDHVNKFYTDGFDINARDIDAESSMKTIGNELETVPISFVRIVQQRLNRMRIMANVDENYEFDVNSNTRCDSCEKMKGDSNYGGFEQCESCAEKDVLKLLTFIEFFVLSCRHQRAGTLQVLDQQSKTTTTKTPSFPKIDSQKYVIKSDNSSSESIDNNSDIYYQSDESSSSSEGDTVIAMPVETLSTAARTQRQQRRQQTEMARRQRKLEEKEDDQECHMQ